MSEIDPRVADLLKSPLGCACLWWADGVGLTAQEISEPVNSLYLAAYAADFIRPWRSDREEILDELLRRGSQYTHLARALLEELGTDWWFGPLDREHQVWVPQDGNPPDPARVVTPGQPPSNWERYAQKALGAFYTSTFIQGTSSLFAAIDHGVGDIRIGYSAPPYRFWLLKVSDSARVLEIDGPQAWHDLCISYPAEGTNHRSEPDFSGDEGRLVPDWSAVAADWDAVNLTFGGWLTAEQVRVESPPGWTYHWAWDAEQTMWLRWMFTSVEEMPDHQRVAPPVDSRGSPGPLLPMKPGPSTAPLRRYSGGSTDHS